MEHGVRLLWTLSVHLFICYPSRPIPTASEVMSTSKLPDDFVPERPDRPIAGVFVADPANLPPPPPGAHAVVIKDARGEIVSCSWRAPGYGGQRYFDEAWEWFEARRGELTSFLRLLRH